jgi:serine/threonine protein phosphatase PrpC
MSEDTALGIPREDPEAEKLRWLAMAKAQPKKSKVAYKKINNKKGDFDLSALANLDESAFAASTSNKKQPSLIKNQSKPSNQKKTDVEELLNSLQGLGDFPEISLPPPAVIEADELFASLTVSQQPELQPVTADSLLASLNGLNSDDMFNNSPAIVFDTQKDQDKINKNSQPNTSHNSHNNSVHNNNHNKEPESESRGAWNLLSLFSKKPSGPSPSSGGSSAAPKTMTATGVLRYFIKDDMNKAGLKKVKKPQIKYGGKGKAKLQMEDMSVVEVPFIEDKRGFFGVFDGHVDKNAAVRAKSVFPREFEKQIRKLKNLNDYKDLTETIRTTFYQVDSQLSEYEFEGTTASVVFVWKAGEDRYLQAGNVGDSTAFLCRNGMAEMITKDHKVTDADEIARLKQGGFSYTEGQTRINGLAVSRALGDHFLKQNNLGVIVEPYISPPYKLNPQDTFIIVASDGLWDAMSGQEAVDLVKDLDNPEKMARKLVLSALHSPKCTDNITVIVVTL